MRQISANSISPYSRENRRRDKAHTLYLKIFDDNKIGSYAVSNYTFGLKYIYFHVIINRYMRFYNLTTSKLYYVKTENSPEHKVARNRISLSCHHVSCQNFFF